MAKISCFWQFVLFLPPQMCIFPPWCPPTKNVLVLPLSATLGLGKFQYLHRWLHFSQSCRGHWDNLTDSCLRAIYLQDKHFFLWTTRPSLSIYQFNYSCPSWLIKKCTSEPCVCGCLLLKSRKKEFSIYFKCLNGNKYCLSFLVYLPFFDNRQFINIQI